MSLSGRLFCSRAYLLLAVLLLVGCEERKKIEKEIFGDVHPLEEEALRARDLAPYLELARAVVLEKDPSSVKVPERAGRRAFVTLHIPHKKRIVSSALASTLEATVRQAAEQAREEARAITDLRVQLDVVSMVERGGRMTESKPPAEEIGIYGFLAYKEGRTGYVIPGEILWDALYRSGKKAGLRAEKIRKKLAKRGHFKVEELGSTRSYAFRTVAVVDSAPPGKALELYRGSVIRPVSMKPEGLLDAVKLGADYLTRITDESGRYIYNYRAGRDRNGSGYNMLRHSGTTHALLEAYEETDEARYLDAATRALAFLKEHLHPRPDFIKAPPHFRNFVHLIDEEKGNQSKVGGAGLALLAFSKHAALTGMKTNLETMRGLARFIAFMQEENGHFLSYFDYRPGKKEKQKEVLYYPGEAMLGLLRLYALDPDPFYLEIAKKGADYLIHIRDKEKDTSELPHDHWLSMALNELYRVTKQKEYAEHAFTIAEAIMEKQKRAIDSPAPDFVGSFYRLPNSTPASVRLEAFVADITLARFMGRPDEDLLRMANSIACFIKTQQFDDQRGFYLPNLAKAKGGVRESVVNNNIRIDYVQHALSGMLGLARVLRDPDFGRSGVPAVIPVRPFEPAGQ